MIRRGDSESQRCVVGRGGRGHRNTGIAGQESMDGFALGEPGGGGGTVTPSIAEQDSMDRQKFGLSDVCHRVCSHRTVICSLCKESST